MDAGIVHQPVQGAGLFNDFGESGFKARLVGDIACDVYKLPRYGLGGLGFGTFAFAREASHREAAVRKFDRNRGAYAAAGACDCDDFGFFHVICP